MTQAPMPAMQPAARRPGPSLGMSFIVMGVGLAIAIASVVAIVIPLLGSFTSRVYDAPGTYSVHLRAKEYIVYQHTGSRSVFGSSDSSPTLRILPSAVIVLAPDGSTVPVSYTSKNETITRGSNEYTASLQFDAPTRGLYQVRFNSDPTRPTTVIIARSITDAIHGVLPWFGVGALGGFLMVAGLVMLIVGATRRGRAKRAQYAYGAPQQQWNYQDWSDPQQQQWAPPQQQWGQPPPQQQWGPPPQQPPPQQQWPPPQQTPPTPQQQPPAQQQWPPPPTEPPPADPPAG